MKRHVPVGRRARVRIAVGGPRAIGRPAVSKSQWDTLVYNLAARAGYCCEVCRARRSLDPHHVVKRSAGGADDLDNLVALCRSCHDRTDWPYVKGRLCILAEGGQRFTWWIVRGLDKRAPKTCLDVGYIGHADPCGERLLETATRGSGEKVL